MNWTHLQITPIWKGSVAAAAGHISCLLVGWKEEMESNSSMPNI